MGGASSPRPLRTARRTHRPIALLLASSRRLCGWRPLSWWQTFLPFHPLPHHCASQLPGKSNTGTYTHRAPHTHTQEPPPSFQKLLPKSRLPKGKSRVSGSFRVLLFSRSHPTGVRFFASFPLPVTPFPPSSLLPLKGSTVSLWRPRQDLAPSHEKASALQASSLLRVALTLWPLTEGKKHPPRPLCLQRASESTFLLCSFPINTIF